MANDDDDIDTLYFSKASILPSSQVEWNEGKAFVTHHLHFQSNNIFLSTKNYHYKSMYTLQK